MLSLRARESPAVTPAGSTAGLERQYLPALLLAYALSNVTAYARDASVAGTFGASAQTDAYFVGAFIPILLSTILVSESLIPAFLPSFVRYANDRAAAARLAGATITISACLLGAIVVVVFIAAAPVIHLIAAGWHGRQVETAAMLLRITSGSVLAVGAGAVLGAVANSYNRYLAPPLGSALSNLTVVAATLTLSSHLGIFAPAWGMLLGSGLYLALQVVAVLRVGVRLIPTFDFSDLALAGLGRAVIPMLIFACLAQNVPVVERWLASGLPSGQLSYLSYAGKLMMSPMLVISTASNLVTFVAMSRASAAGDLAALRQTLARGARLMSYLLLMATLALVWLGHPIVRIALQRGKFTSHDAGITATLLAIYALGLVPNGLSWLFYRSLQARGKFWVSVRTMLAVTAIYAGCAVLLFQRWKLEGLAAAFPLAQTIQLLLLSWQQPHELRTITRQGVQYAVGLVLLALSTSALVVAANRLTGARVSGGTLENLLACITGGLVILACFVGGARLLRMPEGILVERWMRTAIQAPVRLVAWTKDW